MAWLDDLKAKVGDVVLGVTGAKPAPKKSQRGPLIAAIDHNLAQLADPQYVLPSGKGKGKKPAPMYKLDGNKATVWLPYGRKRLNIARTSNQLTFDASHLKTALEELRKAVETGAFDKQIAKAKASKSADKSADGTKAKVVRSRKKAK